MVRYSISFFDLYEKALKEGIQLFTKTNDFLNNKIKEKEYLIYLKHNSYITGLPWMKKTEIKHLEF